MTSGREYKPNEEHRVLVEQMSAVGIAQEQIAAVLDISVDCMYKYYKKEVQTSKTKAVAKIAGTLFKKALGGDTASMIFYLKTQGRWKEVVQTELTGIDGQPITLKAIASQPYTEEEFKKLYDIDTIQLEAPAGSTEDSN